MNGASCIYVFNSTSILKLNRKIKEKYHELETDKDADTWYGLEGGKMREGMK